MKTKYLFLVLMLITLTSKAQDLSKYEKSIFISKNDTLPYRILFPEKFDASKKYPLILVLHGAGERGSDNEAQLTHGGSLFLNQNLRSSFPAIVVFPQCPKSSYWSNVKIERDEAGKPLTFDFQKRGKPTEAMAALLGLTDRLLEKTLC